MNDPLPPDGLSPTGGTPATTQTNAANEGVARLCGPAAQGVLTLATLGVSFAMGSAVLLLVTKRTDVARATGVANLVLAGIAFASAARAAPSCLPIGVMAASLPLILAIASFTVSIVQRKKNGGSEANSG